MAPFLGTPSGEAMLAPAPATSQKQTSNKQQASVSPLLKASSMCSLLILNVLRRFLQIG
jgi:hypothetical protein